MERRSPEYIKGLVQTPDTTLSYQSRSSSLQWSTSQPNTAPDPHNYSYADGLSSPGLATAVYHHLLLRHTLTHCSHLCIISYLSINSKVKTSDSYVSGSWSLTRSRDPLHNKEFLCYVEFLIRFILFNIFFKIMILFCKSTKNELTATIVIYDFR